MVTNDLKKTIAPGYIYILYIYIYAPDNTHLRYQDKTNSMKIDIRKNKQTLNSVPGVCIKYP